jgi:predicted esterase
VSSSFDFVFLHGYDSKPGAMLGLAESVSIAFPDAEKRLLAGPVRLANGERVSFAWWEATYEHDDVAEAVGWLESKLNRPTMVVGFSQGGALALAAAACQVPQVIGVVAMSAFMPDGFELDGFDGPVLLVHGEDDEVVDVFNAERVHRQAIKRGLDSTLMLFPGGHCLPEDHDVAKLISWLQDRLAE